MNKSIILVVLCVLATALFVQGQVKLSFVNDYLLRQAENIVEITFDKVYVPDDVIFTARQSKADSDKKLPAPIHPYRFSTSTPYSEGPLIGALAATSCVDTTTKQVVGQLVVDDDQSIIFTSPDPNGYYLRKYTADGPFPTLTVRCLLSLDTETKIDYTNLYVTYFEKPSTPGTGFDLDVPLPAKGYVVPGVVFKSLAYGADLSQPDSSTSVDIEFTADTVGIYRISTVNAPGFTDRSLETGDLMSLYCSSGLNKLFARAWLTSGKAAVHVDTIPANKQTIKCKFYIDNTLNFRIVRSERSSVQITLGEVTVSKTLNLQLVPGAISGSFASSSSSGVATSTVQLVLNRLSSSTTPINVNSTIQFVFSKNIDVTELTLATSQQEYRSFTGCGAPATISIDKGKNSIILNDNNVANPSQYSCTFTFVGSDAFAYDKLAKMGGVSVSVDGKSLTSAISSGTEYPLYLPAKIDISSIAHEETLVGEEYTVVDTLSIHDGYSTRHRTPTQPILIIGLGTAAGQHFTHENHASQLTCKISTPTDSHLQDLKLTFSPATLSWSAPLKDIVDLETYNLSLQCTRKRARVFTNGLETTRLTSLNFQVIDLVDGVRYVDDSISPITASTLTTSEDPLAHPPLDKPASAVLPKTPVQYAGVEAAFLLQTTFNTKDTQKTLNDALTAALSDIVVKAETPTPVTTPYSSYKFTAVPTASTWSNDNSKSIYNATSDLLFHNILYNDLAIPWVPFEVTPPMPYTRIIPSSPQFATESQRGHLLSSTEVWMTVESDLTYPSLIAEKFPAAAYALWEAQNKKVVTTDLINVVVGTDQSSVTANAHWGSPIEKCGQASFKISNSIDTDFKWDTTGPNYEVDQWFPCALGETCAVNADCAQVGGYGAVVCKASVCTALPYVETDYVAVTYTTGSTRNTYQIKKFHNAASAVSTIAAIAAVVVAALLF